MKYSSKVIKGKILKRYKRFLSDIEIDNEVICAHVPNTGSMKTCWEPGWDAYLTYHDDPKRKLKYTLELLHNGESFININTSATNKIVKEALENNVIKELPHYSFIKPECKILDSRLDFYLSDENSETYLEVKNVTLKGDNGTALFPDSVSTRGQKHLRDLIKIKEMGKNAVMLYVVNRSDVEKFSPAESIDPEYAKLLKEASSKGVLILAYQTLLNTEETTLSHFLPVIL